MPASYIPLRGPARVAIVGLGLMAVLCAASIGFGFAELRIADRVLALQPVSDADLTAIDERNATMQWVALAIWAIAGVCFIRWLHPAYCNVSVVAPAKRRFGEGWAIGGWFVPILNLWRPKQVINDVWRAGGRRPEDARPGWLLLAWWGLWIVADVVLRIASIRYGGADTPEEWRTGTIIFIAADALSLIAAFLAVAVVRVTTDRLDERAAAAATPPEPDSDFAAPERPAGVPA